MNNFQYEWWTVEITTECGKDICEFKGKSKESVIRQIEKYVKDANGEENQKRNIWIRKAKVLNVNWDSLKLDRKGYQRRF